MQPNTASKLARMDWFVFILFRIFPGIRAGNKISSFYFLLLRAIPNSHGRSKRRGHVLQEFGPRIALAPGSLIEPPQASEQFDWHPRSPKPAQVGVYVRMRTYTKTKPALQETLRQSSTRSIRPLHSYT